MDLAVVELRRYTLVPGRRDEMISVFERELMEGQQEAGMFLLGLFRDLDRPDHFVWLRGFRDMDARQDALTAFYSGPVWKEHAGSVRPTMIDTDDVLLLRPAALGSGLGPVPLPEPDPAPPAGLLLATTRHVAPAGRDAVAAAEVAAGHLATFVTEPAENTYRPLPVRADASVVVTLDRVPADHAPSPASPTVGHARLAPTARSPLRP
jgi:quinol monooxygenase YgiN